MTLMTSDQEASLLEAGKLSRALSRRYDQAVNELLEPGSICELFMARQKEHQQAQSVLDKLARQRNLLPREADDELNDLRRLGDWAVSLVDSAAESRLLEHFLTEEKGFQEELECAGQDPALVQALAPLLDAARHFIDATKTAK